MSLQVEWLDSGREPKCAPDPRYPNGIDVDVSCGSPASCVSQLPYPAQRCGVFRVVCKECGYSIFVTTAGRLDDPRSIRIPCQIRGNA